MSTCKFQPQQSQVFTRAETKRCRVEASQEVIPFLGGGGGEHDLLWACGFAGVSHSVAA